MPPTSTRREGFALAVAMVAIVVIGALIAGAFFTSTQEYRIGRNSLMAQRAFAAAEAGAVEPMDTLLRSLTLNMAPQTTRGPDTLRIPGGSYAVRFITRLDSNSYWVTSDGYAGGTTGALASHNRVNAAYRIAVPSFNILGALTVKGTVEVQGSSRVDGTDQVPPQWSTSGICPPTGGSMPGVAAPDTSLVCSGNCPQSTTEQQRIFGDPAEVQDPAAADTNTYYRYGDQTWNTLTASADIRLPGGNYKALPDATNGRCNYSVSTNWGDPSRTTPCGDYFPIIFIDGSLKIQSNSRGQGILLVNGDMEMQGGFEFNGIVIVRDDIRSTGTGNKIVGSAFAGNTYTTDNTSVSGNSEIQFSRCAIARASRGAATIVRLMHRGFVEVIQ
jgi:hypothetical protein